MGLGRVDPIGCSVGMMSPEGPQTVLPVGQRTTLDSRYRVVGPDGVGIWGRGISERDSWR